MARISGISIKQQPEHHTFTIRKTIDFLQQYADFADQAITRTGAHLDAIGVFPLSGPIALFHNTDLECLDVEIGWQIVPRIENRDDMTCRRIRAHTVATAIDLGPYEEQDPTLTDLLEWIGANGYEAQGPIQYCYLNDADRPPAEYLTLMTLPVGTHRNATDE